MSPLDFVIIGAVSIALLYAVLSIVKQKRENKQNGGCNGHCNGCSGCHATPKPDIYAQFSQEVPEDIDKK